MYQRHLEKLSRTRLDDVLLDEGQIDRAQVEDAAAEHEMTGRQLSDVLFEREVIDEWDLAKIVSAHYSLPFIDVTTYTISKDALAKLPTEFCIDHALLPLDIFGKGLMLAVAEMPDPELLAEIRKHSGLTPFLYVAVRRSMFEVLTQGDPAKIKQLMARNERAPEPEPEPVAAVPSELDSIAALNPVGMMGDEKPVLSSRTPPVLPERKREEPPKTWEVMFDEIDTKIRTEPGD